jgi:amidohydrolase
MRHGGFIMSQSAFTLVEKAVDSERGLLESIARRLFGDPELSLEETRAAAYLSGLLEESGFTVERGCAGLPTAFIATLDSGKCGASFGLIAEYDALSGIGHGCGHNLIAASAVCAARALSSLMRGSDAVLSGKLIVYGTPAEETYGGKVAMVRAGLFSRVEESVMIHPESATMVGADALACENFRFTFTGKAAHAASFPYHGINALDAVIMTFNAVGALRQQTREDSRIHGIVTKGGEAVNVIPECCEAVFCVRSKTADGLSVVREKVLACARGAALSTGTSLDISSDELPTLDMVNDLVLTGLLEEQLGRAGFPDIGHGDPYPGSSDYGDVSHATRASYAFFDTGARGPELHSRDFADFTVSPLALERTLMATRALAAVVADRLSPRTT